MTYTPRRSRKRWLVDAPEYVLACYDNDGKTCDRYTVLIGGSLYDTGLARLHRVNFIGMSDAPTHPQGFSQGGEMPAMNRAACGKHVRWLDLPQHIRQHVVSRCTESV